MMEKDRGRVTSHLMVGIDRRIYKSRNFRADYPGKETFYSCIFMLCCDSNIICPNIFLNRN